MASTELITFFESLQTETDLERLIQEKIQEDLYIEFKLDFGRSGSKAERINKTLKNRARYF
jgi:hypothetical protein